jgi:hypothetical protein
MRKSSYISKIMALLLLVFVLSAQMLLGSGSNINGLQKTKTDPEKTESVNVYQSSPEVVIPSYDFHFDTFYFEPIISSVFDLELDNFNPFLNLKFKNSYFEKLFEHHIAINAP